MKLIVIIFLSVFVFSMKLNAQVKTNHQLNVSNCTQKATEETEQLGKKLSAAKLSLTEAQKDSLLTAYKDFYCKVASLNDLKEQTPGRGSMIADLNTAREKRLNVILSREQYNLYRSESERTQQKYKERMQNREKPKS
jgi:hypothetical protein